MDEPSFPMRDISTISHENLSLVSRRAPIFDGFWWTRWTSEHWVIPLSSCVVYLIMVFFLPGIMEAKAKLRLQPVVIVWNFGLSFFSVCYYPFRFQSSLSIRQQTILV